MFRNRSVQVKFVKTATGESSETEGPDLDKISETIQEQVVNTAFVVAGVIVTVKVVDTVCKIAINITNPANWR